MSRKNGTVHFPGTLDPNLKCMYFLVDRTAKYKFAFKAQLENYSIDLKKIILQALKMLNYYYKP